MGIEETKDVVRFGVALGNVFGNFEEDSSWVAKAVSFVPALTKLPAAASGIGDVKAELADLDEEEAAELHALVVEEFDIKDDHAEEVIEKAIDLALTVLPKALDLYDLVKGEDEPVE